MKKQILLTFVLCLPFLSLFSSLYSIEEKISEALINEILSNAPGTIEKIDQDRLYL